MFEISSAAAATNSFFDFQAEDPGSYPPIDAMKLQKLLFYGQAWSLALNDSPMFLEEVYAWPWGPVVPSIYDMFKDYRNHPIVGKWATQLVKAGPNALDYRVESPRLQGDLLAFARGVWDSHKSLSGVQLSNATHAPGEPWTLVKDRYGTLAGKPLIPNDLIKEVFKNKVRKN